MHKTYANAQICLEISGSECCYSVCKFPQRDPKPQIYFELLLFMFAGKLYNILQSRLEFRKCIYISFWWWSPIQKYEKNCVKRFLLEANLFYQSKQIKQSSGLNENISTVCFYKELFWTHARVDESGKKGRRRTRVWMW